MIDSESALAGGGYSTTVVLLCMPKYKLNPRHLVIYQHLNRKGDVLTEVSQAFASSCQAQNLIKGPDNKYPLTRGNYGQQSITSPASYQRRNKKRNKRQRSVRSSQKRRNAREERAKYGSACDAFFRAHRAIFSAFPVVTAAARVSHRVRASAWAEPGHGLIQRREVDRSRCDGRGEARVQPGCDEDGSATCADGGCVRRGERHVHIRVEWARYRAGGVREDVGARDV